MASPGASPRLMSPTEASRSGLTVTATGAVTAAAPGTRARTSTRPGRSRTRPRRSKSPSESDDEGGPKACQAPSRGRDSRTSSVPFGAFSPARVIQPPGATTRSDAVARIPSLPPMPGRLPEPSVAPMQMTMPIADAMPSRTAARSRGPSGRRGSWGCGAVRAGGAGGGAGGAAAGGSAGGAGRRGGPKATRPAGVEGAGRSAGGEGGAVGAALSAVGAVLSAGGLGCSAGGRTQGSARLGGGALRSRSASDMRRRLISDGSGSTSSPSARARRRARDSSRRRSRSSVVRSCVAAGLRRRAAGVCGRTPASLLVSCSVAIARTARRHCPTRGCSSFAARGRRPSRPGVHETDFDDEIGDKSQSRGPRRGPCAALL